ncbi:phage tail family protein [Staphylococcus pseudintermedius]|uniref:phage distal tail protein n=1 Tax=Staphylococcus pseudintermedius TaxID=283734 RepID=UPI001BDE5721|nr:phage tail domain-containing protein [Staphylococcus pseudintermedius]EIE3768712.1 phage tail family protein [Staphylococcus pseudintermedius]ELH4421413.1 phage tail family protein [Staphylococcus pseudintermedius]ELP8738216.1 phage tail family protein [Staphylococcus pseudintermedius]HAR5664956.1 phage tail protein [Staphylococcus pseudintermedius]HBJ9723748.1 phage tail family protein [Staphylococcus pseudintermedius]
MTTILINGKKLDFLLVKEGFEIPSFNFNTEVEKIPGRAGSIKESRELNGYDFEVPLIVDGSIHTSKANKLDHDSVLNDVVKLFNYNEEVTIQFSDMNWYWKGFIDGPLNIPKSFLNGTEFTVKIVLADPYKYAVDGNQNTAISDAVSVVNSGTADTPIIVEARALKDSTNFIIAKDERNYFMIGKSEDANKVTKDIEPFVFNDEFHTTGLSNWRYMPNDTSFGNLLDGGDAMGGKFKLSKERESIYPEIWGNNTQTNWHGPAIYKSLTKSVQDFRIRFKVSIHQGLGIGTGKAVAFLVDENNRTLFSITYVNTSATTNNSQILVYAYNEHNEARRIYKRDVPQQLKRLKNIHAFIFLERKGTNLKVTTYFYDINKDPDRKKPLNKDERITVDRGNLYQRPARIARLYRGKAAKYSKYLWHSILAFKIQELLPKQSDVTPIEIREGDLIQIDMHRKSVTINDEDALSLKDFGSNYFNVDTGVSELVVYPSETFDTTVKWQDRYL